MHEANNTAGLLKPFVLLKLAHEFPEVRVEWIGITDASVESFRRGGGQAHLVRLTKCLTVSRCHFLNLRSRRNMLEEAFAQNVIKFVTVRIDRGDRDRNSLGF